MCMHSARHDLLSCTVRPVQLCLLVLASAFLFVQPLGAEPSQTADVQIDERYDHLFVPQKHGFLGADGAASVPLDHSKVLWIFGDTVIGSIRGGKREGPMIHNSIALQDLSAGAP